MKRLFLCLAGMLGLAAPALAQHTAPTSLTAWTSRAGAPRPQYWLTTDDMLSATFDRPVRTGTVEPGPAADDGAVRLTTVGRVPGCLVLGTDARHCLGSLPGGLPYTGRPCAMRVSYRLSGPDLPHDAPFAQVTLTRTVAGRQQVVAAGSLPLPAAATYTQVLVPIQYTADAQPDSVHIVLSSGSLAEATLHAGTTLHVRQVGLGGTAAPAASAPATDGLGVFPNPSLDGRFVLDASREPALAGAALTVSNSSGRVVLTQAVAADGATRREVDLQGQPAGVYTLQLLTTQGTVVRRLLVR